MKKSLISYLILFSIITANAQSKPFAFTMGVKADNTSQKDLYKRGKFWYVNIFDGFNKKLIVDNPSQGLLVGKGSFQYDPKVHIGSAKTKGTVEYQVKLRFREGMYEYEITDFRHKGSEISFDLLTQAATCSKEITGVSPEWKNQVWDDIKSQAEAHTKTIIKSLITEISGLDVAN